MLSTGERSQTGCQGKGELQGASSLPPEAQVLPTTLTLALFPIPYPRGIFPGKILGATEKRIEQMASAKDGHVGDRQTQMDTLEEDKGRSRGHTPPNPQPTVTTFPQPW